MAKKAAKKDVKKAAKKAPAKKAAKADHESRKDPAIKSPLEAEIADLEAQLTAKKRQLSESAGGLPPVAPVKPGAFATSPSW